MFENCPHCKRWIALDHRGYFTIHTSNEPKGVNPDFKFCKGSKQPYVRGENEVLEPTLPIASSDLRTAFNHFFVAAESAISDKAEYEAAWNHLYALLESFVDKRVQQRLDIMKEHDEQK